MEKSDSKQLAAFDPNATSLAAPSYLKQYEGGHETGDNFDNTDVSLPQIKLLQGTSEQIKNFEDAKPGEFWHTGADLALGPSIRFVVCSRKKKYLLQAPLDDGQGVLARADDAKTWDKLGSWQVKVDKKTTVKWEIKTLDVEKSGLIDWGTYDPSLKDSPPAATLFYEYLVILPDHLDLGPCILSLARSAIKKAKRGLNDKIAIHLNNKRPMQSAVFSARPVLEKGVDGEYYNWNFTGSGFASEEVFHEARSLSTALITYKVLNEGDYDPPASSGQPEENGGGKF